jgi:hypothetical protein
LEHILQSVVAGGWGPPNSAETEEFNGTAFTNEESLPTDTRDMAGFGTQTAGVACVGAIRQSCNCNL